MKVKIKFGTNYFNSTFNKTKQINMKNKALLVGINKYPNPRNELRGCVNDIIDMQHFISETHKVYERENIKMLTNENATKKGIVAQINWLIEGAQEGDQLLFHYSGHGAQTPTLFKTAEKDGLDEIICPYDYDGSNATTLRDKEFALLFAKIPKGVHFVWISDSCHAEDLSRDPIMGGQTQYRNFVGANQYPINQEQSHLETLGSLATILKPLNGALLSACASHELSADAFIENRYNGAFTFYLLKNLLEYGAHKPMELIVQLTNIDLQHNGYDQSPQSEGLMEKKKFFL
jgi:hypothetical protein